MYRVINVTKDDKQTSVIDSISYQDLIDYLG